MRVREAAAFALFVTCAVAYAAFAAPAEAQSRGNDSVPPGPSLYTPDQATRGERVYRTACVECHETLEYTGPEFRAKWNGRPAFELFDLIRSTMPEETPGSLTAVQYADVLGYMMKLNAVPPGKTPLPAVDDSLKKITLAIPVVVPR